MYRMQTGTRDWVAFLPTFVQNYNNVWQRTIKMKPVEALYLQDEPDIQEVKDEIKKEITPINAGLENKVFRVGDRVRLQLDNLGFSKGVSQGGTNWSREIYTVRLVTPGNESTEQSYRVKDESNENVSDILYANDMLLVTGVDSEVDSPRTFIVQRLLRPSIRNGVPGYIVKWRGYSIRETSFEPREQLMEDVPKVVQRFEADRQVNWLGNPIDRFTWNNPRAN